MAVYPTIELYVKLYEHFDLCYVTSTTGGGHATHSYHYRGMAIDIGSGNQNAGEVAAAKTNRWAVMDAMAHWLFTDRPSLIAELIHTHQGGGGYYVKNGHKYNSYYSSATRAAHKDHVHLAVGSLHNAEVLLYRQVQFRLNQINKNKALTVDGDNGPKTKAAVKKFQKAHGLTVDGVVGNQTVAAIRSSLGWKKL